MLKIPCFPFTFSPVSFMIHGKCQVIHASKSKCLNCTIDVVNIIRLLHNTVQCSLFTHFPSDQYKVNSIVNIKSDEQC